MADEVKTSPKIKVVDRRWFTESGEPREDEPPGRAPQPPPPEPAEAGSGEAAAAPGEGEATRPSKSEEEARRLRGQRPPEVSFLHLVNFLAQQAALLLQGAEGLPKDVEQARMFVDLLAVLEAKTSGNLTAEEARFLSEMLFQLRTLVIQATA